MEILALGCLDTIAVVDEHLRVNFVWVLDDEFALVNAVVGCDYKQMHVVDLPELSYYSSTH